jgi:hypothetical protein
MAILLQLDIIDKPSMWSHVGASHGNQPYAGIIKQTGFIGGTIVAFVAEQSGTWRQHNCQFMDRCQIVKAGRKQLKTDGNAAGRTDQMQAPAKEFLPFGGTIPTIRATPQLATAPGAYASTDRQRHTIDHKYLASLQDFAQGCGYEGQPIGQRMQPAVKSTNRQASGQVACLVQDANRALMMVLEILGSNHGDQEHLRIGHLRPHITAMSQLIHQGVDQDECPVIIHSAFIGSSRTTIFGWHRESCTICL